MVSLKSGKEGGTMLHMLLSTDWTAGRDTIMNRISSDVKNRKGNRILIVPELISHEMERRLCASAGNTASRYAEVLSFTRLARRVSESMGNAARECLDNGGRLVAMAASARQLSSRLKAYASVETKPEFLSGLIDAIDEFKRCCISPEDLQYAAIQSEGSLAQKLEELSLLMETYDALCSRGKRDPRDQMTWLLEQLKDGTFGEEHTFYIDGFPDFTRQNLAILEHLIQVSPSVTVSLNCDSVDSPMLAFEKAGDTARQLLKCAQRAGVEVDIQYLPAHKVPLEPLRKYLFQGPIPKGVLKGYLHVRKAKTPYQECMDAADHVFNLVANGCRYRDISLVCTDLAVYQPLISLVFDRFHIPVYQTGKEDILQKSVIATVLTALEAALTGFDQRNVFRYLRSALSPLDPDICDLVENYAVIWAIRGQKWEQEWVNHPEGLSGVWSEEAYTQLNLLNQGRTCAIDPLKRLYKRFRDAKCIRDQVLAVYGFMEEIDLEQRLAQMAEEMDAAEDNRSAQILNQLWDILVSALEQMYDVLGETYWENEHFTRLFKLLLSRYDVGTIPPVLDAVQMGPVSAMRCNQQKHLIVLGAEEGKLPGYSGSSGVLTDYERVTLRELGVPLTGGAAEGIQAEFAEIYGVFCGATQSVQVYCSGEQPSFVFRRLSDLAGSVMEVEDTLGFARADQFEAGVLLSKWNGYDEAVELGLQDHYRDAVTHRDHSLGKVTPENIRKLYGSTLNLSASQIDTQAECRLSYFLKYGLRAKERKEAAIDPAEFGTYVHDVLENTAAEIKTLGGFHNVTLDQTMEIAHRYSEAYAAQRFSQLESERVKYLFNRNIQELDMVVEELWRELKDALFEPVGFEVSFGNQQELPPIAIPNDKMNAILRGFVDRVDVWQTYGSSYYRVVDYKTGRKEFDYCDVFNGVGLQMLLYMFALRHSGYDALGEHPVPAGVQYFPARAPYITQTSRPTEEKAEKDRSQQWKRQGLLLEDEAVLNAMAPAADEKNKGSELASREQMNQLKGYIFKVLAAMVEDIASGNVDPDPYTRGDSHNACRFCPYGTICHKQTVAGRRNYKTMKRDRFWEEIDKEMDSHGR